MVSYPLAARKPKAQWQGLFSSLLLSELRLRIGRRAGPDMWMSIHAALLHTMPIKTARCALAMKHVPVAFGDFIATALEGRYPYMSLTELVRSFVLVLAPRIGLGTGCFVRSFATVATK